MIIYKITNKLNNMNYIGQTIKPLKNRVREHFSEAKLRQTYFNRALYKYGINNFYWEILKECKNQSELDDWEKYFIKNCNSMKPNGYNLINGGLGGAPFKGHKHSSEAKRNPMYGKKGILSPKWGKKASEETRKKIGDIRKGKTYEELYGLEKANFLRKNLSESRKGIPHDYKHSDETKKTISKKMKIWRAKNPEFLKGKNHPMWGKRGESHPNFGKHHTDETKRIMSIARKKWCMENKDKISGENNSNWKGGKYA